MACRLDVSFLAGPARSEYADFYFLVDFFYPSSLCKPRTPSVLYKLMYHASSSYLSFFYMSSKHISQSLYIVVSPSEIDQYKVLDILLIKSNNIDANRSEIPNVWYVRVYYETPVACS